MSQRGICQVYFIAHTGLSVCKKADHNSVPQSLLHNHMICYKLENDTRVHLGSKDGQSYACKPFVADPVKPGFYVSWFYVSLNSTHVFFFVSKRDPQEKPYIFLEFTFFLLTHFLDFLFKLSIICPIVVILSIFNSKSRKEIDNSVIISCLQFRLYISLLPVKASRCSVPFQLGILLLRERSPTSYMISICMVLARSVWLQIFGGS